MAAAFSEARVAMETPRRYMSQLCKHFEHKVPVTLDQTTGSISFPMGECALMSETDMLVIRVTGLDKDLPKLEDVVARHLLRFAFRHPPTINWVRHDAEA